VLTERLLELIRLMPWLPFKLPSKTPMAIWHTSEEHLRLFTAKITKEGKGFWAPEAEHDVMVDRDAF